MARAAVVGAGTMGAGIAMGFANAGIPVTVIETGEEALRRGLDRVAQTYATSVKRGSLAPEARDARLALIEGKVGLEAAADADVVVEAVFEEMALKREIFAALDGIAKPGAVLATNTSYLDVDEIAAATGRPQDVLGMHFFSPANVMRLLEVVRGAKTAPDALATAVQLGTRLSKVPVVSGVCYGFIGNRMLARRTAEAERLLIEGASPQEVDRAITGFGFRMGPFAMADSPASTSAGASARRKASVRRWRTPLRSGAARPEDRQGLLPSILRAHGLAQPDPAGRAADRRRLGAARRGAPRRSRRRRSSSA